MGAYRRDVLCSKGHSALAKSVARNSLHPLNIDHDRHWGSEGPARFVLHTSTATKDPSARKACTGLGLRTEATTRTQHPRVCAQFRSTPFRGIRDPCIPPPHSRLQRRQTLRLQSADAPIPRGVVPTGASHPAVCKTNPICLLRELRCTCPSTPAHRVLRPANQSPSTKRAARSHGESPMQDKNKKNPFPFPTGAAGLSSPTHKQTLRPAKRRTPAHEPPSPSQKPLMVCYILAFFPDTRLIQPICEGGKGGGLGCSPPLRNV